MVVVTPDPSTGGIPHFPLGGVCGEFFDNGRRLRLTEELIYVDGTLTVSVPAGFYTDFNSVPRGLWNFFPPWEYPEAGVVHDYLYQHPGKLKRQEVDAIHRRICEIEGMGAFMRRMVYLGIRLGGGKPWGRYRDAGLV